MSDRSMVRGLAAVLVGDSDPDDLDHWIDGVTTAGLP